ncbi:MAG TPA: phage tail protein, partial [Tahibacter sp.]|nr:phage tail protein [Tahibacter sp.]
QPEGLVNIVDIKVGYKPYEDGYDDAYTFNFKLEDSVALHKSLGRGSETIEVKSMAASGTPSNIAPTDIILFGQAPGAVSAEKAAAWSRRYLAILAIEYSLVTIAVPFKFFDLLVGDVVEVTHQYIPNGQGGRGVVSKKACIVRRRWNLDPQQPEMGELTLYFPRYVPAGYTPSGMITGYTSLGGNTWRLTFNQLNDFNKAWSENDDGNVLKHFAAGDLIRVIQYGVSVPVVVTGTVSSVDAGSPFSTSLVVAMDSALSTSGNRVLMWRSTQAALTTRQKSYCYVATANRNLPTGYARLYL